MLMRSKLFNLIILFVISSVFNSYAQIDRKALIVLNNGNKIKGAVIESYNDKTLKATVDGYNEFIIRYDLIKRISFKGSGKIEKDFEDKIGTVPTIKTESFYHEIRGELLFGEENTSGGMQTINGYQFNRYLGTGLGLGLNKFGNYLTMPIYAQVKGYLYDKKVSPFYFGDIGYGFAWKTKNADDYFDVSNVNGGLYWQLGLGYQINFYNSAMTFSFGYINQDSTAEYTYFRPWDISDVEVTEDRVLRRFAVSVGFIF